MDLLKKLFQKKKHQDSHEDVLDWCIYDPDIVCDLFEDCYDCCYYHEWKKRGRNDIDTNFDDWGLDQGKFDFNHYDDKDEHHK